MSIVMGKCKINFIKKIIVTFQGFDNDGLSKMINNQPQDETLLCPVELKKKKILKVDPSTGLSTTAAINLKKQIDSNLKRTISDYEVGVIILTSLGNYQIIKKYVDRINRNIKSPALYAASGYNINASAAAMGAGIKGPSLALTGDKTSIFDSLLVANNYILRKNAGIMLVGHVDVHERGESGVCIMFAICSEEITVSPCYSIELEKSVHQYSPSLNNVNDSRCDTESGLIKSYFENHHSLMMPTLNFWNSFIL
jgi:3-oxoacyl-(acyl-carrier-protein) synthase